MSAFCGVKSVSSVPSFLESWLCRLLSAYSCASYLASLCLSFIIYKMGTIAVTRAAFLKLEYEHTSAC